MIELGKTTLGKTTNIIPLLQRARDLLASGWVQGLEAVNLDSKGVHATSAHACRWCATGAIRKAVYDEDGLTTGDRMALFYAACHEVVSDQIISGGDSDAEHLAWFNDLADQTQEEMLELFDKHIQRLKAEIAR